MSDQREAWESFYSSNPRPWRGVSDLGEVPFTTGQRILELGCGNGKTVSALVESGLYVTGVDFSRSAIDTCKGSMGDKASFVCGNITDLPFGDGAFDGAVAFHVLEHLSYDEMRKAVSEIRRVLRKRSHVLVRCFAKGDLREAKGERVGGSAVLRGNGILYRYFSEDELIDAFEGFICKDIVTFEERTKFGSVRSRIHADFSLP